MFGVRDKRKGGCQIGSPLTNPVVVCSAYRVTAVDAAGTSEVTLVGSLRAGGKQPASG